MRRLSALLSALPVAALVAGCTSILGDFTTGAAPASDASSEAASDATTDASPEASADGAGPADGTMPPSDAAADRTADAPADAGGDAAPDGPPAVLTCNTWRYGTPLQVISLEGSDAGQRTLASVPVVVPASGDTALVVVSPQPTDFAVYQAAMSQANVTRVPPNGTHGSISSFSVTEDGVAVVTVDPPSMGTGADIVATDIPSTLTGGDTVPPGTLLGTFGGYSYFTSAAQQLAAGSYAYAFSNSPSNGTYGLYAGLSGSDAGPLPIVTTANRSDVDSPSLVHANGQSYVFLGDDGDGVSEWDVPDDRSTTIQGPRTVSSTGSDVALLLAVGPSSSPSKVDLALADGNLSGMTLTLRIGALDVSKAYSFATSDLPAGPTFTSFADLPINGGGGHWQGDDFLSIGQGMGAAGANFVWVDVNGNMRGEALGSNDILSTDTTLSQMNASFSTQIVNESLPLFDVVWSDRLSDGAGEYDVVYVNQLECH